MKFKKSIQYIIQFLLGEGIPAPIADLIGYTSDRSQFHKYKIVILPSGFFDEKIYGTKESIPSLPLRLIENVPLLYGNPIIEKINDTLLVHADIIAGAYFLISRYEEILKRNIRDEHGRFPGKESLPFKAGFIDRPVVDEYGQLLRKWFAQMGITISLPDPQIRQINLTHDVDAPFFMRSWRNIIRSIKEGRNIKTSLQTKFGPLENDPFYTFPWFLKENQKVIDRWGTSCQSFFFFRTGGRERYDRPRYNIHGRDIQKLFNLIKSYSGICGLHSSYEAGKNPQLIPEEKKRLEKALNKKITTNRHHFLALREPENMAVLEEAGITDDYTMGYADIAGFRLGTSRPVYWIDAQNIRLSSLKLHPLTIMEGSLSEKRYMALTEDEATNYSIKLIKQVASHHGELTLLWHNTSFSINNGYLKSLYQVLIHELCLMAPDK